MSHILMMSDEHAAEVLGCTLQDSPAVIRQRFKTLVQQGHPDLNPAGEYLDVGKAKAARDQLVRRYWRRFQPAG